MTAQYIDFTTIATSQLTISQQEITSLDQNEKIDVICRNRLEDHREHYRKLFENWLEQTNAALIDDIDSFIDKTLSVNKDDAFPDSYSQAIHPAQVILGMQSGDHQTTLDMIHNHISEKNKNLEIIRVTRYTTKKNDLRSLLEEAMNSKQILVLIEQTESLELSLLEYLIIYLSQNILNKAKNTRIIILFCMASSVSRELGSQLSLSLERMRPIISIVKVSPRKFLDLQNRLISSDDRIFKLGPSVVDLIYDSFCQYDPSIARLRFVYECAITEHLGNHLTLSTLDKKQLINLFKSDSSLIDRIKNLKSVINDDTDDVNWSSESSVAQYCSQSTEAISEHHEFLISQIQCYHHLIKDETERGFPASINDIYGQLWAHSSLAYSPEFMNAIDKLRKYSSKSILERIKESIANFPKATQKHKSNIHTILSRYKKKIENNQNCQETINKLTKDLHDNAVNLLSPRILPLYEAVYFNNAIITVGRTTTSTRNEFLKSFINPSDYYETLYNIIHNSSEEISKFDLYNDFKQAAQDLDSSRPTQKNDVQVFRGKSGTNKKLRRSTRTNVATITTEINSSDLKDDGLMKAIFTDLLDSIEHQGLIKTDSRKSKKGLMRRVIWL